MDKKYNFLNNLSGWFVWLIATVVYLLTIEPTASFWDCGEFIAAADKLQVGHPPGAPLWLMVARIFGLFATEVEGVAAMVNSFSALCSSFSILFLFWSITAIAKKFAAKSGELNSAKNIAIIASGAVGALAYTFSDSFWFSAVEGEVYAASSFFTAIVFWLILKWEANADQPFADRYLLLIAYLMGLSIGVHILNLLAIPAIVYVYYFKKFKFSFKGMIYAGIISVIILGVVQKFVISYSVQLAAKFELFFVNSLGFSFNTGMWFYLILLFGGLAYAIYYTAKIKKPNWHNALIGVLLILIGYSSFAMIIIRSAANPPMDENNPDNIISLIPYINREQYGDSPLLYGQTFNSELDFKNPYKDGKPVYFRTEKNGEDFYAVSDDRKQSIPQYNDKTCMIFPRMYSSQSHHVSGYKAWSGFEGNKVKVVVNEGGRRVRKIVRIPTVMENISFFINYQINFSYWRYFMWNFTGRQNDIQGHGKARGADQYLHGNWLSGIPFVDDAHLGDQSSLPDSLKNNPARNTFYFLPLILGLIGLVYSFAKSWKDGFVIALLFFMTGLAVILYLNPVPFQPRERDYAYAGSFYAFAIWIGLGVQALFQMMFNERLNPKKEEEVVENEQKLISKLLKIGKYEISIFASALILVGLIAFLTNDLVVANGMFYVGGVILFLIGFTYLIANTVKNNKIKAIIALIITLPIPVIMGMEGWDDHDRSNKYTARDFARNYLDSCEPNAIIFTNGDNDTFPLWYVQDVEGYRTDVRVVNLSLLNTDWYIDQMKRKAYESDPVPFSMEQDQYRQGTRDYVLIQEQTKEAQNLHQMMEFVKSDNLNAKLRMANQSYLNYFPTRNFKLPIDSAHVASNGTVIPDFRDRIVDEMEWSVKGNTVMKAQLMILDLLSTNNWERPVYFAITVGGDHYMGLEEYFTLEGLAYKLTPAKHPSKSNTTGENGDINIEKMYDNFMNKFSWGNMKEDGVYVEEQSQRMCMNFRSNFARLAKALVKEKQDNKRAEEVLDKCMEVMPRHKVPYNYFTIILAEAYYTAGAMEKGNELMLAIAKQYGDELKWYFSEPDKVEVFAPEIDRAERALGTAGYFATMYEQEEVAKKVEEIRNSITEEFGVKLR